MKKKFKERMIEQQIILVRFFSIYENMNFAPGKNMIAQIANVPICEVNRIEELWYNQGPRGRAYRLFKKYIASLDADFCLSEASYVIYYIYLEYADNWLRDFSMGKPIHLNNRGGICDTKLFPKLTKEDKEKLRNGLLKDSFIFYCKELIDMIDYMLEEGYDFDVVSELFPDWFTKAAYRNLKKAVINLDSNESDIQLRLYW